MDAKQVPLRELLASVPADARLLIDDADGKGSRSIPVGRLCQEAAAALAQEQAEPVAWYFEARHIDSAWAAAVSLKYPGPGGKYVRKVTRLYAAPQRRPLTEDEIRQVGASYTKETWIDEGWSIDFARAIERAHGIV